MLQRVLIISILATWFMEALREYVIIPNPISLLLISHKPNILVGVDTNPPRARIADFGITIVTRNLNSRRAVTRQNMYNPLWSAPEVLNGENPRKESDIYSFSMVMFEVPRE